MTNAETPQQTAPLIIDQVLQQAIAYHQAGQLQQAGRLYRAILQIQPDHSDVHFNLGLVAEQVKQVTADLPNFKAALEADPSQGRHWQTYAEALLISGQAVEAVLVIRTAMQCGLDTTAIQILRQRAEDAIRDGSATNNLGISETTEMLDRHGQPQTKVEEVPPNKLLEARRSAAKRSKSVKTKKGVSGSASTRKLLPQTEVNQLVTLFNAGRYVALERRARLLLGQYPNAGFAWKVLGASLQMQDKDALHALRKATELLSDDDQAHSNLGVLLEKLGQFDEAEASCRRALRIKPDSAAAHYNLGNALLGRKQLDDAVESYRRALKIKPDYADAYGNLGYALRDLGQLDDALASFQRALEIKPDLVEAFNNLLFVLNYHPDLSAEEIYLAYQAYDTQLCIPLRSTGCAHSNDRNPNRRLRVGYVSPDFRQHSCRSYLEPLLAHHDKTQIEVYTYAELTKADDMTAHYQSYADHWIETRGMSDKALAERISADGIDILVELAGHTKGNRLLAFARKPAPVSLSWLGYGYTTGLSAIDYYLTDEACVPAGSEGLFSEQPWHITTPAYVYRPGSDMGEVSSLPALQRGYITFGTLTRLVRINHRTIRVWSELLAAVPNSRLVMDSANFKDRAMQERMAAGFAEYGISHERLEIGFHSPPWDVLRGIDIGLDCFPHNSGATLFETLYMGVPYITLASRPSVGRLGSSVLQGVGHPEWIAGSEAEYVTKAAGLAHDLERLAAHRASLRREMEQSPLLDEAGFTRKVEAAYRQMWRLWCKKHGQES
ncbi:MAG: tetratricopeptide repeat protein [Nitrosomonas sp.]|nr:tetratricopeptide repeat protein [Nitrosomonas sp.]